MTYFQKCSRCNIILVACLHWNDIIFDQCRMRFCDTCYKEIIFEVFKINILQWNWIYKTDLYKSILSFLTEKEKECPDFLKRVG
jgi:hypothetical protein